MEVHRRRARAAHLGSLAVAAVAAFGSLSASGCATTWAVIQLARGNTYSTDGHETNVTPLGDREERLDVRVRSLEPLQLVCTLDVTTHERVDETWHRWGFGWKVIGGVFFGTESLIGATGLALSVNRPEYRKEPFIYGYVAADALATGILLLALSPETSRSSFERKNSWPTQPICPDGLVLRGPDQTVNVGPDGRALGDVSAWIGGAARRPATPWTLEWRGHAVRVEPSLPQRCAWAAAQGDVATPPGCPPAATRASPGGVSPPPLPPPLPPLPPVRIEIVLPRAR